MAQSADSNFTGSGGNACLGVTWRLHFWQNGLGLLRAIAVAQGGTLNESQHTKLTLEKKILLPLFPGFKLATFWSRVQHPTNWAILAPQCLMKGELIIQHQLMPRFVAANHFPHGYSSPWRRFCVLFAALWPYRWTCWFVVFHFCVLVALQIFYLNICICV